MSLIEEMSPIEGASPIEEPNPVGETNPIEGTNLILKGNICYSLSPTELQITEGYLICEGGLSRGVFSQVPKQYARFPIVDYGKRLIIPGLCDLHIHAPQYAFRGRGMDLELLDWLNTYAFPEEAKYADLEYADKAYDAFVEDLKHGATTRACVFATMHTPATLLLMEKLERSGLITFVGKVNMDTNSPEYLCEKDPLVDTRDWIENSIHSNTKPILTPRFIPTCTDKLLSYLKELQIEYNLPIQSHLSENQKEIAWVKELYPHIGSYGEVYNHFGLFGGDTPSDTPTVMAHCVWSEGAEERLLKENNVLVAHCPQSNTNIASGIAPIRRFLKKGIRVGLASDVAGGCHTSIFRAMSDAVQVSKLYWRLINQHDAPLTEAEVFYLATVGGGSFFGKVGSFEDGYEFDAVVLDECCLERAIYLDAPVHRKYVRGVLLWS